MQIMKIALILSCTLVGVLSASLRTGRSGQEPEDKIVPSSEEIKEKYEKVDDFLEVLFTMSCKWTHGADIAAEAHDLLKQKKIDGNDVIPFTKDRQAENLKNLKHLCEVQAINGGKQCRYGCTQRHYGKSSDSTDCQLKCDKVYDEFLTRCNYESDNLEKVYFMKNKAAEERNKCKQDYCEPYPHVWEMHLADAKKEVDDLCKMSCTKDHVRLTCEQEWVDNVQHLQTQVDTACHEEAHYRVCYDEKADKAKTEKDFCRKHKAEQCELDEEICHERAGAHGAIVCETRAVECDKTANTVCHNAYKSDLTAAEKRCQEIGDSEYKQCQADRMDKAREDKMAECFGQEMKSCNKECHHDCHIDRLHQCFANSKQDVDPAKEFCTDFWRLLHTTSDVDPVTGDPVVLLSTKAQARLGSWP